MTDRVRVRARDRERGGEVEREGEDRQTDGQTDRRTNLFAYTDTHTRVHMHTHTICSYNSTLEYLYRRVIIMFIASGVRFRSSKIQLSKYDLCTIEPGDIGGISNVRKMRKKEKA